MENIAFLHCVILMSCWWVIIMLWYHNDVAPVIVTVINVGYLLSFKSTRGKIVFINTPHSSIDFTKLFGLRRWFCFLWCVYLWLQNQEMLGRWVVPPVPHVGALPSSSSMFIFIEKCWSFFFHNMMQLNKKQRLIFWIRSVSIFKIISSRNNVKLTGVSYLVC